MSDPKFSPMPAVLSNEPPTPAETVEINGNPVPVIRPPIIELVNKTELDRLKEALVRVARSPHCTRPVYAIASDALGWAREFKSYDGWQVAGDGTLPEDRAIAEAFPTRSGRHDLYATAARLVGAKRSKPALIALVNWLLLRLAKAEASART